MDCRRLSVFDWRSLIRLSTEMLDPSMAVLISLIPPRYSFCMEWSLVSKLLTMDSTNSPFATSTLIVCIAGRRLSNNVCCKSSRSGFSASVALAVVGPRIVCLGSVSSPILLMMLFMKMSSPMVVYAGEDSWSMLFSVIAYSPMFDPLWVKRHYVYLQVLLGGVGGEIFGNRRGVLQTNEGSKTDTRNLDEGVVGG